jgi:CRP-like cAMP-binding protein
MNVTAIREKTGTFPHLRETQLREYLSETQLKELERFCSAVVRKPGTTVFRQGELAEAFYMVIDGSVELRARPPGRSAYRTVELIRPTCSFGDEALFGEGRYLASARTLETTRLLTLPRSAFDRLAEAAPAIGNGVLRCAGSCLLQTLRRSAILTQAPADVGLRLLLSELATVRDRTDGHPVPVRITHAQLAGVLHISRETVSRMLRQLEAEGVVDLGRGVIRVRSPA